MNIPLRRTAGQEGFTLIEILVVMGIIAVLAAIVLIAINPARQFAQSRDTQRTSNVEAILNAVGQYIADHGGDLPPAGASAGSTNIPSGDPAVDGDWGDISNTTGGIDLCSDVVPNYMAALPLDPKQSGSDVTDCSGTYDTGYQIIQDSNTKRISIRAPQTEVYDPDGDSTINIISITR